VVLKYCLSVEDVIVVTKHETAYYTKLFCFFVNLHFTYSKTNLMPTWALVL